MRTATLLCVAFLGLAGCTVDPQVPDEASTKITAYYHPRSTDLKYTYKYFGGYSGRGDSMHTVEYVGINTDPDVKSVEGYAPIHFFDVRSTVKNSHVRLPVYVSDSTVVEYGVDYGNIHERFIPLKDSLHVGGSWVAAQAFRATPQYEISFLAKVSGHFDELLVSDSLLFRDVWQVVYHVTGSPYIGSEVLQEFRPGATRVIYFARDVGKVLEVAYSPEGNRQWSNELVRISRR